MPLLSSFSSGSVRSFGLSSFRAVASAATDAYFNLVTLLLNTSSTNGAQNNTFLDSSTNNFTITRNGNTTQGTFSPFSQTGWSFYGPGNTNSGIENLQSATSSQYAFGTGDWCVEMFFYRAGNGINPTFLETIIDTRDSDVQGNGIVIGTRSNGSLWAYDAQLATAANVFSNNTWNHVAYTRQSGAIRIIVNGILQAYNGAYTNNYTSTNCRIKSSLNAGFGFNGYISNARVIKGNVPAQYQTASGTVGTEVFTPPTAPLTVVSGTSLLTCQDGRLVDNSANNFALTVNGTPQVQAFSPFLPTAAYSTSVVGGSGYFDGTGDLLQVPSSSNLALGTGDFTLELWVYPTSWNSALNQCLFSGNGTNNGPALGANQYYPGKLTLGYEGVFTIIEDAVLPTTYMWSHVACTRSGNTFKMFINGVQSGSTITYSPNFSSPIRNIGSNTTSVGFFNGYISSARIIKGTALYTTTFTPPTAPLTAIADTQLLLNYTNSGIFDSASKNVAETVGDAQASTTQAKWGTTSMYFANGGADYLVGSRVNDPNFTFSGDFTVELWLYVTSTPDTYNCIIGNFSETVTTYGWNLMLTSGRYVHVNVQGASNNSVNTVPLNTWTHLAIARSGSTVSTFINGIKDANDVTQSATAYNPVHPLRIGRQVDTTPRYFFGYMDDIRITNGYARYTANFTPPTAAFPTQ